MPHREILRNLRVRIFDDILFHTAQEIIPALRLKKITNAQKIKEAAKFRRNLTKSLEEMRAHQEQYEFGPIQLKVLDTLIAKARKAKSEKDLMDIWRNTCFLKNGKR